MRLPPVKKLLGIALLLGVVICRQELFAQDEKFPFSGKVNSNNINLRADSRVSAEIICTLARGENAEVLLELYGWYKIKLPRPAPAYVRKDLCACLEYGPSGPAATNVTPSARKYCRSAKITASRANIRLAPSESSPVLGRAEQDEIVHIVKETGEWFRVEPTANCFGWVNKKFIARNDAMPKGKP